MCLWNIWGWEGDGRGKGDKVGKTFPVGTCTAKHQSPGSNSSKAVTVSSLLGKNLGVTRVTAPVVLWPVQRGTAGSEMPADIHSTAPGPGLTALQELVGRNSVQIALSACSSRGTGGTLLCCGVWAAPFSTPFKYLQLQLGENSEMRARVGVSWGWWDCSEEDTDTSTRKGNPFHF